MNNKLIAAALAVLMAAACLSACASAPDAGISATPAPAPDETPVPTDSGSTEAAAAYRAALTAVLEGEALFAESGWSADMSGSCFAVCDVDMDGSDELLIQYTSQAAAGQLEQVCGWTDGGLTLELGEYPLLTYLDNGTVKADWSHNQGMGGEFWPYSLYKYDAGQGSYALAAMVDAWDKSFAPENSDGEAFPDDIDTDGAGIVYYIMTGGSYELKAPVSQTDYDAWYAENIGAADRIEVTYLPLTAENIAAVA